MVAAVTPELILAQCDDPLLTREALASYGVTFECMQLEDVFKLAKSLSMPLIVISNAYCMLESGLETHEIYLQTLHSKL